MATDAARRAWALRVGVSDDTSALELNRHADLARRAAWATPDEHQQLADRGGLTGAALEVNATAWRAAGQSGLDVLDEPSWTPPVTEMVAAKELLESLGVDPGSIQVRANRVTVGGHQQFRRSHDGHWYLFVKQAGRWAMASGGATDLDDLVDSTVGTDADR